MYKTGQLILGHIICLFFMIRVSSKLSISDTKFYINKYTQCERMSVFIINYLANQVDGCR